MEKRERIETGIIQSDDRHTSRRMRSAIQGNVIRALVELVTNSDDSYTRLESEGKTINKKIEIEYQKTSYNCEFTVRDYAEGMSIDDVKNGFTKYGAATSGLKEGKRVRGFFGQGAKDALACMKDGKICTFKNDEFVECKLYIENNIAKYEIKGPVPVDDWLRAKHKIPSNGTVAYFSTDPSRGIKTPQFDTVHEELANNYLLRKIMTNPNRKIILINMKTKDSREIKHRLPVGEELLNETFNIQYGDYPDFSIHMVIFRAKTDLTQSGDDRQGGLLFTDEDGAVLDISLLKFDNEPLAAKLFGEVEINGFRNLLAKEEAVLTDERNGLDRRHVFCKVLIEEVEKRLEEIINKEKEMKQKEEQKIGSREYIKFKKAFNFLNEIAEQEIRETINLGGKRSEPIEPPLNGIGIFPASATVTVGKRYIFELLADTTKIPIGSTININGSRNLNVITKEAKIDTEVAKGIAKKNITIEGLDPNTEGKIEANYKYFFAEAQVYVMPEKEFLLSEGLAFNPQSIVLHPNKIRTVFLLIYLKKINVGSKIIIRSDNPAVNLTPNEIIVGDIKAFKDITKYPINVWGEGVGQHGIITAEHEENIALLDVSIEEQEIVNQGRQGMFNDYDYDYDPEPLQRASYSQETGKVIIYVNFPTIKFYLGKNLEYKDTLPAQVLIADIFAERCFYEIAKKKVEASSALIRAEAKTDKIQNESYVLSRKYGARIHEMLIDKELLEKSRDIAGNIGKIQERQVTNAKKQ
jgi:hypothetical protein